MSADRLPAPPYPPTITVRRNGQEFVIEIEPSDIDVRSFDHMALNVKALLASDFYIQADLLAFKIGVTLWCRSWHQVPAGSLPSDERLLCHLSGLGADLRTWRKVSKAALHGFEKCSDGRLYHKVVCEKALSAFKQLRRNSEGGKSTARKRQGADNAGVQSGVGADDGARAGDQQGANGQSRPGAASGGSIEGRGEEGSKKNSPPSGGSHGAGAPGVGRGTRIAADWQPSEAVLLWAVEQGWTREWALSRVPEFRDYWIGVAGAKGRKVDWDATFRNRLRDTADRGRVNGSASGTPAGDSVDLDARQWRSRVTVFANSGRWMEDLWGPAPGSAGCRAPPDVLADHGYGGLALGVTSKPAA